MSRGRKRVVNVSLSSSPEYLSRVRRIVGRLADSLGMDHREADETKLVLTEACVNAIRHGSPRGATDRVSITLATHGDTITLDVTDSGGALGVSERAPGPSSGYGMRLIHSMADSVQMIGRKPGFTVRLTKRAKSFSTFRRLARARPHRG